MELLKKITKFCLLETDQTEFRILLPEVEMVLYNYQEKGVYFGRYTNETNEMRNPKDRHAKRSMKRTSKV